MVQDIFDAFMIQQDPIDASIKLPTVFDYLQSSDASFETAHSSQIQTIQLFYSYNVITESIGLVLYHNPRKDEYDKKLDTDFNLVSPCQEMLQKTLKLNRVHVFGDISISQLDEKMAWIGQLGLRVSRKNSKSKQPKSQLLVFMISIAFDGMLMEIDEE